MARTTLLNTTMKVSLYLVLRKWNSNHFSLNATHLLNKKLQLVLNEANYISHSSLCVVRIYKMALHENMRVMVLFSIFENENSDLICNDSRFLLNRPSHVLFFKSTALYFSWFFLISTLINHVTNPHMLLSCY